MIVSELIKKLVDMPPDALVVVWGIGPSESLVPVADVAQVEVVKSIGLMTGAEYYHPSAGISAKARGKMACVKVVVVTP